jgi:Tol biopolymer transport system component
VIVFAPDPVGGLAAVDAAGGVARAVTVVDTTVGDNSHRFPAFLPDGRHFLFVINNSSGRQDSRVLVGSLDDPHAKPLFNCQSAPEFAAPDWVLFTRDRALLAQRLDLRALRMLGQPRLLADQPEVVGSIQLSRAVSCSRTGILAYAPQDRRPIALEWVEPDGRLIATRVRLPGAASTGALSPDHRRLAVVVAEPEGYANWVADLVDGTSAQVAPVGTGVHYPNWNASGTRIVGPTMSGMRQIDPASGADSVYDVGDARWRTADSWTPDGLTMVMSVLVPGHRFDLQTLLLRPGEKPRPYLATEATEAAGELSHDGRWIAYQSDASGSDELYVERFPDHAEAVRAGVGVMDANNALAGHRWRADDRELYFVGGDGFTLYATEVRTAPRLSLGVPRAVRRIPRTARSVVIVDDGRLLVLLPEGSRTRSITVVQAWMNETERSR